MQLIRAEHGGSKKVFQHSLHSQRDVPFTLSECGPLLRGVASIQFSIRQAAFVLTTSLQQALCATTTLGGGRKDGDVPHLPKILWGSSEEEHHLSNLISLSVPMSAPPTHLEECTQTKGGLGCHPTSTQTEGGLDSHPVSTQTEGGSGYHSSLKLLREAN